MIYNYPRFRKFFTYDINDNDELIEIKEIEIISSYNKLIIDLEISNKSIICCRGTSNYSEDNLSSKFIVGDKSNSNFNYQLSGMHEITFDENRNKLINEIKVLRIKVSESLKKRNIEMRECEIKNVNDTIKIQQIENDYLKSNLFLTSLNEKNLNILSLYELFIFKIFLLRIEHTDGRNNEFNRETPFLSLTYKSQKFKHARHFALSSNEKGIIYLYSLLKEDPFYFKTNDLSKQLNIEGILWHKDIYDEITLIGGMFPHYLLAIYEVKKNCTPKVIINPYLYEILRNNQTFDITNGMNINQTNFEEHAKRLNYKTYFYCNEGRTTVHNISNHEEIGEIKNIK